MKRRSFLQKVAAASAMMVCGVASILAEVKPKTLLGADLPSYDEAPFEECYVMANGTFFAKIQNPRRWALVEGRYVEIKPT